MSFKEIERGKLVAEQGWYCKDYQGWLVFVPPPVKSMLKLRGIKLSELRKTLEHYDATFQQADPDEIRLICKVAFKYYIHTVVWVDKKGERIIVKGVAGVPADTPMREALKGTCNEKAND